MSEQQIADRALLELGKRLIAEDYRFVTPTPLTHERIYTRAAGSLAKDLRDVFGWSLPFDHTLFPREELATLEQAGIVERHGSLWRSTVRWSSLDGLLFAHSAYPTTQTDSVFFGPDSYRFAQLIDAHLQQHFEPLRRVLDIGCGAGVGALIVARTPAPQPGRASASTSAQQTPHRQIGVGAPASAPVDRATRPYRLRPL